MRNAPIARTRWAGFSEPNAILAIVSATHRLNHAYSTLAPLIYPMVPDEFHLSYGQIGLVVGVTGQIINAVRTAASGFAADFVVFASTIAAAGLLLAPTRDVTQR